ncbi:MAG: hypothetical protein WC781_03395 [Candidatus Pacearchaeota archaeon]|jgi:hypothetical protein
MNTKDSKEIGSTEEVIQPLLNKMTNKEKKIRVPYFRPEIEKKIKEFLDEVDGAAFNFGEMKKQLFGATWYGGGKFKRKLIKVFNLEETKEKGKVLLIEKR